MTSFYDSFPRRSWSSGSPMWNSATYNALSIILGIGLISVPSSFSILWSENLSIKKTFICKNISHVLICILLSWCRQVSEWLLFNATWPIFQLHHSENMLHFKKMSMMSALYYTNTLSWIFKVLAHWNMSPQEDMSLHSVTLSWFQENHPLLILLNTASLVRRRKYKIDSLWFVLNPRSTTLRRVS